MHFPSHRRILYQPPWVCNWEYLSFNQMRYLLLQVFLPYLLNRSDLVEMDIDAWSGIQVRSIGGTGRVTDYGEKDNQHDWPSHGRDDLGTEPVHQQPHYVADYKARCRAIAEYLYLRLFPHISQP